MNLDEVNEVKIIEYSRRFGLEDRVNEFLKKGWRLLQVGQHGKTDGEEGVIVVYTLGKQHGNGK